MRAVILGAWVLAGGAWAADNRGDEGASRAPQQAEPAGDDTLPHTNPELQEGAGGSGVVLPPDEGSEEVRSEEEDPGGSPNDALLDEPMR